MTNGTLAEQNNTNGSDHNTTVPKVTTATTDSTNEPKAGHSSKMLDKIDDITQYLVLSLIVILFVILVFRNFHFKISCFSGADMCGYASLIVYLQCTFDFWTDLLFSYSMYLQNQVYYFYFSLIFTIIPLFASTIICIYFIHHWQTMDCPISQRIQNYLRKYSLILILFSMIGDFYSSVMLLKSKLFYLPMFNLHPHRSDSTRLKNFRFVNTVLLENIPQLCIQTLYIQTSKTKLRGIVFISMTFTVLSLLVSFFTQISRILEARHKREKKFLNMDRSTIRMIIKCGVECENCQSILDLEKAFSFFPLPHLTYFYMIKNHSFHQKPKRNRSLQSFCY